MKPHFGQFVRRFHLRLSIPLQKRFLRHRWFCNTLPVSSQQFHQHSESLSRKALFQKEFVLKLQFLLSYFRHFSSPFFPRELFVLHSANTNPHNYLSNHCSPKASRFHHPNLQCPSPFAK